MRPMRLMRLMTRGRRLALPVVVLLVATSPGCGAPRRTGTPRAPLATPAAHLARAITWAGGAPALSRAGALVWEGDARIHVPPRPDTARGAGSRPSALPGRVVRIVGRWAVQPPDTAVVTTYDVTRGPATARALVLAAPRGWIVTAGSGGPGLLGADGRRAFARGRFAAMPPALLASERDEFYLYDVLRLVPLLGPTVTLAAAQPDVRGQPGLVARQPGRPDVALYFAPDGRLAHVVVTVSDATSGRPVRQDLWLDGAITAGGVRWPRTLRLTQDGVPFFDLTLRTLQVAARLPADWVTAFSPP